MRKTCLDTVYEIAKDDKDVIFIGSDLGPATLADFKKELPEQFLMEGISEAHIIGMASGLAKSGKKVYVNTIASFLTKRAYEQIYLDLGLENADVCLIGNGGGLVYAPLGTSHLACDDLSLMRAIPNMTIMTPADEVQMRQLMLETSKLKGPKYVRVAKGNEPTVTPEDKIIRIGELDVYGEGTPDVLVVTYGVMLYRALDVQKQLREEIGINLVIVNLPSVQPINLEKLMEYIEKSPAVVCYEEHVRAGGVGEWLAAHIIEKCAGLNLVYKIMSLPNCYFDHYGSQNEIIAYYKNDIADLKSNIKDLLG